MKGFARILSCAEAAAELQQRLPARKLDAPEAKRPRFEEPAPARVAGPSAGELAAVTALTTSLLSGGVRHLRLLVADCTSQLRCKAMSLERLRGRPAALLNGVGMCSATMALQIAADVPTPGSGEGSAGMMNLKPDLSTLQVLPYAAGHASAFGYLCEADGSRSPLCARSFLERVLRRAFDSYGLEFVVGIELEFSLLPLDGQGPIHGYNWASALAMDEAAPVLEEIATMLEKQGVEVETMHSESAAAQFEVVLKHGCPLAAADRVLLGRETIAACARKFGYRASFVPKANGSEAGNGLHLHLSFLRQGVNVFPDGTGVSLEGRRFLAGILEHLPALMALTVPSVNSFRRLRPGCWAGARRCWALEDKEASLRVCSATSGGRCERFEYKTCDAMANPYLALGAVLVCGLDGLERQLVLPEAGEAGRLPATLGDALDELLDDKALLLAMGPRLTRVYEAVKRTEAAHFQKLTLEDEAALLQSKGF